MNLPKTTKRYCPYCKKHTEQKIAMVGSAGRARGAQRRGSAERARKRGKARGMGSHGKWPPSKPAVSKWKKKTKTTKKTNLLYTCKVCSKSTVQKKGMRAGKVQFKEKEKATKK
jgi:large subunit ribosomal protein L44e